MLCRGIGETKLTGGLWTIQHVLHVYCGCKTTLTILYLRFLYHAFLLLISSLLASAISHSQTPSLSCYLAPPLSSYHAPPLSCYLASDVVLLLLLVLQVLRALRVLRVLRVLLVL